MTPEQISIATRCYIEGQSTREIAPQVGAHFTTVARDLRRPEIKALIEEAGTYIIRRALKPAVRTLSRLSALGNTKTQDKDLLKLSLDASKHVTGMAGLSGGTPGTVINAMIQINQAPETKQAVNLLAEFLKSKITINTIDCQAGKSTIGVGVTQSHTPPAPIDVQPEPVTPAGQVEGAPNEPVDNSPDHPSPDP